MENQVYKVEADSRLSFQACHRQPSGIDYTKPVIGLFQSSWVGGSDLETLFLGNNA